MSFLYPDLSVPYSSKFIYRFLSNRRTRDQTIKHERSLDELMSGTTVTPLSQRILLQITENLVFNVTSMGLTVVNVLLIFFEMYSPKLFMWSYYIRALDSMLLGIFTFEIIIQIWTWRARFFRNRWMVFGKLWDRVEYLP